MKANPSISSCSLIIYQCFGNLFCRYCGMFQFSTGLAARDSGGSCFSTFVELFSRASARNV